MPDEDNLLNLQARFVTRIHSLLLPLYVSGAFLTMLGTLYGTIEIACSIADEIVRAFIRDWSKVRAKKLKRSVLAWCVPVALLILVWLFIRQAAPEVPAEQSDVAIHRQLAENIGDGEPADVIHVKKPRLLLEILTPVNLFTGVLSCGLICILVIWMDRRELPPGLQPPKWQIGINVLSAVVFLGLGLKGYWDNEHRGVVVCSMAGIFTPCATTPQRLAFQETCLSRQWSPKACQCMRDTWNPYIFSRCTSNASPSEIMAVLSTALITPGRSTTNVGFAP